MVGILLITHNLIGEEMLKSAEMIVGKCVPSVRTIGIPGFVKPEELGHFADLIKSDIEALDSGDGVLILTDIFGATPSNLAHYFAAEQRVKILYGLNLPMLIRVINYDTETLEVMAEIGLAGASKGILQDS